MNKFGDLTKLQQVVSTMYSRSGVGKSVAMHLNRGTDAPPNGRLSDVETLYSGSLMGFTHPFAIAQKIERKYAPISNALYIKSMVCDDVFIVKLAQWNS